MNLKSTGALALLSLLALTSCDLNKDVEERSFSVAVNQLVIPDDPSKEITAQGNISMAIKLDLNSSKIQITSTDVNIGALSGAVALDPTKFYYGVTQAAEIYTFLNAQGKFGSGYNVSNASGVVSSLSSLTYTLLMSYNVNDRTVKTFPVRPLFSGKTVTKYMMGPAGEKTSENEKGLYEVTFSTDMKKASVVIYNIKFAEEMPAVLDAVILNDLAVEYDENGYTISGTDIIPDVKESNGLTPYPNFPFASFKMWTTTADLASVDCEYVVNAKIQEREMVFRGAFSGRCVAYENDSDQKN